MRDAHHLPGDDDPADPLPGLAGSTSDAGAGTAEPACFDQVLADTFSVRCHAGHRLEAYADLLGPLVVSASSLEDFRADLPSGTHALPVHLVADPADDRDGLTTLREARNGLFDDDRVEITGVQLALPADADPGAAAALLLQILDFSAPTWLQVPLVDGWEAALDVVAEDGTENVAVRGDAAPDLLAAFVRRAVDLDVAFRVTGDVGSVRGPDPGTGVAGAGLLNVLCAVRAAADGAGPPDLARILAATAHAPLISAVRAMRAADAVAVRRLVTTVDTSDVGGLVQDLLAFGLL
ncbi:MAG: hypothetical protein ACKVZ6_23510 [Kineosporiaceae bacterium]